MWDSGSPFRWPRKRAPHSLNCQFAPSGGDFPLIWQTPLLGDCARTGCNFQWILCVWIFIRVACKLSVRRVGLSPLKRRTMEEGFDNQICAVCHQGESNWTCTWKILLSLGGKITWKFLALHLAALAIVRGSTTRSRVTHFDHFAQGDSSAVLWQGSILRTIGGLKSIKLINFPFFVLGLPSTVLWWISHGHYVPGILLKPQIMVLTYWKI